MHIWDTPLDFQGVGSFQEKKNHPRHDDEKKIAPSGVKKKITLVSRGNIFKLSGEKITLGKVTKKTPPLLSDGKKSTLTKLPSLPLEI